MKETAQMKKHSHLRRLMILALVIAAAWITGQLLGPALIKAFFL